MSRAQRGFDGDSYPFLQIWRERVSRAHLQEQQNRLVLIVLSTLSHAQVIINFPLKLIHDGIHLAGTEPHPTWVEHAVASAEDEEAFGGGVDDYEVALPPDTWESIKVGITEFFTSRIIPKIEWERRVGARAYKFARLAGVLDVLSKRVKNLNFEAEGFGLNF